VLSQILRDAARRQGVYSPYAEYEITTEPTTRTYFKKEDLLTIENISLSHNGSLENSRDIFSSLFIPASIYGRSKATQRESFP
jgi:hypothetical protein